MLSDLLQSELGIPATIAVSFVDADVDPNVYEPVIKLELDLDPNLTKNVPLDLELGDFGPISVGTEGNIDVTLGGDIDLDLGFNFKTLTPLVFAYSDNGTPGDESDDTGTRFALTTDIDAALGVTATLGGFEAGLSGNATLKNAAGSGPASISVSVDQPAIANPLNAIPIADLFTGGLGSNLTFAMDGEVDLNLDATLPGAISVSDAITLDDFDPFQGVTQLKDAIDFSGVTDGVNQYLNNLSGLSSMSLDQLIAGSRTVLTTIESGLTTDVLSNIPLVGDGVDLSASFVGELQALIDQFETLVNASEESVDALLGELQQVIFDALGPNGANMLSLNPLFHDDTTIIDVDEAADYRDVEVTLSDPSSTPAEEIEFAISLNLAGRDVIDADFDLGLDAVVFDFETTGGVELVFDYDFNLGFGINLRDGFFFELNPNTSFDASGFDDGAAGSPEIELSAEVRLKEGTSLSGELFFLNLNAETNPVEDFNANGVIDTDPLNEAADGIDYNRDGDMNDLLTESDANGDGRLSRGTGLRGEIFIDINDPSGDDGKLTLGDLRGGSSLLNAGIRAEAFVDLGLSADTDAGSNLPKLSTDLVVDWGLSYSTSEGFVSASPEVAFHDVSLDLGSFFESIAGPAFEIFEEYIEPARPVIDFLRSEVPGFSDISTSTGGPKITFLDLGAYAAGLGDKVADAKKVLDTISGILDAVDEIKGFADADGMIINFGDFVLSGGTNNATSKTTNDPAANSVVDLDHAAKAGSVKVTAGSTVLGAKDYTVIYDNVTKIKFLTPQTGTVTIDYSHTTGGLSM